MRHMSSSDAFTWYMERDPLLRSTVVVVMVFDRSPDPDRVFARLERASLVVPGLRHRLVEPPMRVATPFWIVDPDFDLSWHVRRVVAPRPATLAGVLDFARTEGMGDFDAARPLWTWTTIEGLEHGQAAAVVKIHHSLTDGIGGMQIFAELMDLVADAPEPPPVAEGPADVMPGVVDMLRDAAVFQWQRLGRVARDAAGRAPRSAGRVLREPRAAVGDALGTVESVFRTVRPISDTRSSIMTRRRLGWHYAALDVPLDELKRAGKEAGYSLNDAFLAGIAGGLQRYHESHGAAPEALRVTMPISVRAPGDPAGGNRVTLMRFEVSIARCDPVERMRAVHAGSESAQRERAIPLTNMIAEGLNLLPNGVVGNMLKHVDFVASNVPGLHVPVYLGGARVLQIYPFGPTIGAALNVTLLSYCSTCHVGINVDTGAVPDPDALLACLRAGFDEVLSVGAPVGHTTPPGNDVHGDDGEADDAQRRTEGSARLSGAVGLGAPQYRREDVARLAGVDHERSVRWWRAMGFAEVPEDVVAFAEVDVEIVRRLAELAGAGLVDDEAILRLARLLGVSFSRIAEAQLAVVEQLAAALPNADRDIAGELLDSLIATVDGSVLGLLEDSLLYVWRRHFMSALGRRLETDADAAAEAVGFADLSGFTRLSQRVSVERLAELVDAFEDTGFDVVSSHGGRVVKLVGDEMMFVADSLPCAVDIGLDLAERLRSIAGMPDIHCGIAYGLTAAVGGDVFGPTANLAARLTTIARRGTIVIPHALSGELAGRDDIELLRVRRTFDLKGIGDTRVVSVRRKPAPTAAPPAPQEHLPRRARPHALAAREG